MRPRITVTDQFPVDAVATATVDDRPPSEVWADIASNDAVKSALVDSIYNYAAVSGMSKAEFREEMWNLGLPDSFDDFAVGIAQGYERDRDYFEDAVATIGQSATTTLDEILAVAELMALDVTTVPTIAIKLTREFMGRRRDHRETILELIATLGEGADVRLVLRDETRTLLYNAHAGELPESVESKCNPHRHYSPTDAETERQVTRASHELNGRKKLQRIIELLDDADANVLTYRRIADELSVTRATVRSHAGELAATALADRIDWYGDRALQLTFIGEEYAAAMAARKTHQLSLDSSVEEGRKASHNSRVNPPNGMGEGSATSTYHRRVDGENVQPEWMSRDHHAAVAGCAPENGMALVDYEPEPEDDHRQPRVSYDEDADRLVVGAEYTGPLPYTVSLAFALTSPQVFTKVLTADRLDGDAGEFLSGLDISTKRVLRAGTCLGWLPDRVDSAADYIDELQAARDDLYCLLTQLHNGNYDDRDEFRGAILRDAHGLCGTMTHLLSLAGVDVVREMRILECSRHFFHEPRRSDLLKNVGRMVAVQSEYNHMSAFRQMFESRPEKQQQSFTPDVDALNPHGHLIGSFVLVGDGVTQLEDAIRQSIRGEVIGLELQDDAPELDVGVPIKTRLGRQTFAQTVREILAGKNLSATPAAIAIMQSTTTTPYDTAKALNNGLAPEEDYPGRDIRIDEVRRSLTTLDAARIMPNAPPSVSKMVHALLTVSEPISQSELADRAGISSASVRNNRDILEALGLIEVTDTGTGWRYRLAISYTDERGDDAVVPEPVGSAKGHEELLFDALSEAYGADYATTGAVGDAFFADSPPDALVDADPALEPWVDVALALTGADEPDPSKDPDMPTFGKTPKQTPLTDADTTEVSA